MLMVLIQEHDCGLEEGNCLDIEGNSSLIYVYKHSKAIWKRDISFHKEPLPCHTQTIEVVLACYRVGEIDVHSLAQDTEFDLIRWYGACDSKAR